MIIFYLSVFKTANEYKSNTSFKLTPIIIICFTICLFFKDLLSARIFSDDSGAAWSRIPLMKVALSMIEKHPFLGVGINNYTEVMHNYDNTKIGITTIVDYPVHNISQGLDYIVDFLFKPTVLPRNRCR